MRGELGFLWVVQLQAAIVLLADDDALGEGQGDGEVHFAVVEPIGFEGDGVFALVEVGQKLRLVDAQPG
ncbi:hypothetical protein D9M70_579420 [compost metagenome]